MTTVRRMQAMPIHLRLPILIVFAACGTVERQQIAEAEPRVDLQQAIAEMRNLPQKLEGAEAAERGPRIQKAWDTLIAAKDAGAEALLAEARQLAADGERDDRFRLGAGAVAWRIGGLARVDDILTRDELRELCAATAERGRIPEPFECVQARHLLAAATAADLALLIDARGGLYQNFSDEQIEAVEQFERALLWLVRAQYRVDPDVCEQVQRRS